MNFEKKDEELIEKLRKSKERCLPWNRRYVNWDELDNWMLAPEILENI